MRYSLDRLSELTGISPRNIRAYIAKDLLPGPLGKGRGSHYTEVHRNRLIAIQQLRTQYKMPLDKIRRGMMMVPEQGDIEFVPITRTPRHTQSPIERSSEKAPSLLRSERQPLEREGMVAGLIQDLDQDSRTNNFEEATVYCGESPASYGDTASSHATLAQLVGVMGRLLKFRSHSRVLHNTPCHLIDVTPEISILLKGEYLPHQLALVEQYAEMLRDALTNGINQPVIENDDLTRGPLQE